MSTTDGIKPPYPLFVNTDGSPLDAGFIFIGVENLEPTQNPVPVYWDAALTIPAAQPLRTLNGHISRGGSPSMAYMTGSLSYSILIQDKKGQLVYSAPSVSGGITQDASLITYTAPHPGAVATNQSIKNAATISVWEYFTPARWAAWQADMTIDVSAEINAATADLFPLYDVSKTLQDSSQVPNQGHIKTLYFPAGIYCMYSAWDISFRNYMTITGENEYNTIIRYLGPGGIGTNTTFVNAACSSYLKMSHLTLDGAFRASCLVYSAGNGTHAPGIKGNSTGNYFGHMFFWNQPGDLAVISTDYPDQYNVRSAMLCMTTDYTNFTSYYSCDDSIIENCRFATNSVNNNYALAVSSSNIMISDTIMFCANAILMGDGAIPTFTNCCFEVAGYQAIDATHNHAVVKYDPTPGRTFGTGLATLIGCYSESGWWGTVNSTAVLAYMVAYPNGGSIPFDSLPQPGLLVIGGLYSCTVDGCKYINIGQYNHGNIVLRDVKFQNSGNMYVYAPNCFVECEDVTDMSAVTDESSNGGFRTLSLNSVADVATWSRKISSHYGILTGEISPTINIIVGNVNLPSKFKFISLDEALAWCSTTKTPVVITAQKNVAMSSPINLHGADITIRLATFNLDITAIVTNYGKLTIDGQTSGNITSVSRKLYNYGTLKIMNLTSMTAVVTMLGGIAHFTNVVFAGSDDNIGFSDNAQAVIYHDTCSYTNTAYVANRSSGFGEFILRSTGGATPTTGKWYQGTIFQRTSPASGAPAVFYATASGVGVAAAWKSNGNLA